MGRGRVVKLVFLGTPEFAVPSLSRLHETAHQTLAVLTQPDRPFGRGQRVGPTPVKRAAIARRLKVLQPESLDSGIVETVRALSPEILVVVAYGLILPPTLLRVPPLGCVNVHASLLPRHRGAAPVVHAILKGDTESGVTTILMDEGIDTGPLLLQRKSPIGPDETAGEVESRLSILGAELLVETLDRLVLGDLVARPQDPKHATFAPKFRVGTAWIHWEWEGPHIANLVRAMNPRPGASTTLGGHRLKIWRATAAGPGIALEAPPEPGTLVAGSSFPRVFCGRGTVLEIRELQIEGRRRVTGEEALRGRWFAPGDRFGEAPTPGEAGSGPAPALV